MTPRLQILKFLKTYQYQLDSSFVGLCRLPKVLRTGSVRPKEVVEQLLGGICGCYSRIVVVEGEWINMRRGVSVRGLAKIGYCQ